MLRKIPLSLAAFAARCLPTSFKQAIYKIAPLATRIRRVLNRAAPEGITEVKVAGGDLQGMKLLIDMQTEKDYWLGTYEPELQSALHDLVRPGMILYDVGANIGYVSLLLAKAAGRGGHVYAFEALPSNLERLRGNLGLNHAAEQVTVVPGAVTGKSGKVHFLVHASGGMGKAAGSAGRSNEPYRTEIEVDGTSLDEFVFDQGNPPPQVIKMDIEGGEVLALPGMRRLLREEHPLMLMELHGEESARAAWDELSSAGYRISWMTPGLPPVPSLEALGWKSYIVARREAALPGGGRDRKG